jgi:PAS domain S-box-containing protein
VSTQPPVPDPAEPPSDDVRGDDRYTGHDASSRELDEARLLSLEARLNDIELIVELDGTIHHVNDRAVSAYGFSREELQSMNIRDLRGRTTVPDVGAQMRRADEGGVRFESVHRRRDGSEFPVEVSSRGFTVGGVRYLHSLVRDLTETRAAEARIAESEERLRSIVAAMAEGIVLIERSGRVLASNEAAERILGLSRDEMVGHSSVEAGWRAIREDGTPFTPLELPGMVTLRTGEPRTSVVMGIQHGGSTRWASVSSEPLWRPHESVPYAAVSTFTDITDLRRGREALEASERRYRRLFEHLRAAIVVFSVVRDADGRPVDWTLQEANGVGRRALGPSYPFSVGRPASELLGRSMLAPYIAQTAGILADADGRPITLDTSSGPLVGRVYAIDDETIVAVAPAPADD